MSPSARGPRLVELVFGTGIVAVLLTWLIRQVVSSVAGAVKEASLQSVERTMAAGQRADHERTTAFETMARTLERIVNPPQTADTATPAGPDPWTPQTWWADEGFDPQRFGLDHTDELVTEPALGVNGSRAGTAMVQPGQSIIPGVPRPDLAGEAWDPDADMGPIGG